MEDGFTCSHPKKSLFGATFILFVTFINICFSFTKERPWSSKDRIGLSEEGEKRKKFSSETHYWWAKWVRGQNQPFGEVVCTQPYTAADEDCCILKQLYWHRHEICQQFDMTGFSGRIFYTKNHASRLFPKMCFRYLNSGLRFLVTLVLILALAFFTCGVFIVFCRKCDDKVCTTIKFLTRASKISLPQTKENNTAPDKENITSQNKENISLPDKGKYHSPRQRKISLPQTKENITPPDKGK